jgi:hypothetical protein
MTASKDRTVSRASRTARGSRQAVVRQATSDARRRAAAVLEVLAGVRTPAEAAAAVGVTLPRYYLIEQRAIGALVASCEPVQRGPQLSDQRRIAALEREIVRLKREAGRHQALARAAQRTLGLTPPVAGRDNGKTAEKAATSGKSRRKRRPTVRALRLAKELAAQASANSSGVSPPADVEQPASTS